MKSILNNELESKVEKLKHMKLEVMQPKIKKEHSNYQYLNKPYRSSSHDIIKSIIINLVVKNIK